MSTALLTQLIIIFLLTGVGFVARKCAIMDGKTQSDISALVIKICMPAVILASANKPLEPNGLAMVALIFAGGLAYHAVAIVLTTGLARAMKLPKGKESVFVLLTSFSNVAFIGYPIIAVFLPENGAFYASFFVVSFNLIFYTYGIMKISGSRKLTLRAAIINPPTLACFAMIALYLLQVKLPAPIQETVQILGNMSTPLSMLVIGSMLGGVRLREIFTTKLLYLVSFVRLLAIPSIVFVLVRLLSLPMEAAIVILVMSALPSGSTTALAAQIYHTEPDFASKGVMQTTLFFALSVAYLSFLVTLL